MNRQPHPDGAKRQARQVYEQHGSRRAAEVTGLPRRTINAMAKREGWQRRLAPGKRPDLRVAPVADVDGPSGKTELPAGNRVPASRGLASRVLLRRWADVAALALDQVEQELAAGHSVKARDCATVAGIATQRGLELAKAAGGDRHGRPDRAETMARLQELHADLRARKVAGRG